VAADLTGDHRFGVAFIVAAEVVWAVIAFSCSSPQTAEINIRMREDTLMKWVHMGQALALATIVIAATFDKRDRVPILLGGTFAMITAESFYIMAKKWGLENGGPETEKY
jgi:uncharacterized protein YhhL (DUF1145 family)